MSMEPPVLRLGLAGFSADKRKAFEAALQTAGPEGFFWRIVPFIEADAWWVNGAKVQSRDDGTLRVGAGSPSERALQIDLKEVDRPVAFASPVSLKAFQPVHTFDPESLSAISAVLQEFSNWLMPVAAQFCLAAEILRQESVLGAGVYHVNREGVLLAVVNLQGEIGVSPMAAPADFEDALWSRQRSDANTNAIPAGFLRTGLSQLMWQYALRTSLDVLPPRYREGLLYFRRAPRVPQRVLKDIHLLLLRELATAPMSFDTMIKRTGLNADQLARELAALYLVGSITSNPKRAAAAGKGSAARAVDPAASVMPSALDSDASIRDGRWQPAPSDLTAPAPMSWR